MKMVYFACYMGQIRDLLYDFEDLDAAVYATESSFLHWMVSTPNGVIPPPLLFLFSIVCRRRRIRSQ